MKLAWHAAASAEQSKGSGNHAKSATQECLIAGAIFHLELEVTEEAPQKNMATRGMPMATTAPVPVPYRA